MTLEFECEMAKCHDELQKAQNTNLKYYRIVERREKQLVELREAVAWCFESEDAHRWHCRQEATPGLWASLYGESMAIAEHAEQQLREMIDG